MGKDTKPSVLTKQNACRNIDDKLLCEECLKTITHKTE